MFLSSVSSLLKKIVINDTKEETKQEIDVVTDKKTTNLPSWKDNSIWTECALEVDVDAQCKEIQETVTGEFWDSSFIQSLSTPTFSFLHRLPEIH